MVVGRGVLPVLLTRFYVSLNLFQIKSCRTLYKIVDFKKDYIGLNRSLTGKFYIHVKFFLQARLFPAKQKRIS